MLTTAILNILQLSTLELQSLMSILAPCVPTDQLAGIRTKLVPNLAPITIGDLDDAQIQALPPEFVESLTKLQVDALKSNQIKHMSDAQRKALKLNPAAKLTPAQVDPWFSDEPPQSAINAFMTHAEQQLSAKPHRSIVSASTKYFKSASGAALIDNKASTFARAHLHLYLRHDAGRAFIECHADQIISENINQMERDKKKDQGHWINQFTVESSKEDKESVTRSKVVKVTATAQADIKAERLTVGARRMQQLIDAHGGELIWDASTEAQRKRFLEEVWKRYEYPMTKIGLGTKLSSILCIDAMVDRSYYEQLGVAEYRDQHMWDLLRTWNRRSIVGTFEIAYLYYVKPDRKDTAGATRAWADLAKNTSIPARIMLTHIVPRIRELPVVRVTDGEARERFNSKLEALLQR